MDTPTTSRRRSQRLYLEVRVLVEGKLANKKPFQEETHTSVLNAHGALVEMSFALEQGQTASVLNIRTGDRCECRVKIVTPGGPGKFNVALEFINPNPGFWRISFPPDDWTIHNPEAKRNG
jgi:hypothetical protein